MKHMTIRNVDADLAAALDAERKRRGSSLTQTVKDLLRRALHLGQETAYRNGLRRFAGDWSDRDLREFQQATADLDKIDEEEWR